MVKFCPSNLIKSVPDIHISPFPSQATPVGEILGLILKNLAVTFLGPEVVSVTNKI